MTTSVSRRHFLATTALGGIGAAAAVVTASGEAKALSVQPMDARTHELYQSACGGSGTNSYHQQLVAEVTAKLKGQASEAEVEATLASLTCPICGCPLAGLL